jgi:hypothetical protein
MDFLITALQVGWDSLVLAVLGVKSKQSSISISLFRLCLELGRRLERARCCCIKANRSRTPPNRLYSKADSAPSYSYYHCLSRLSSSQHGLGRLTLLGEADLYILRFPRAKERAIQPSNIAISLRGGTNHQPLNIATSCHSY